MFRARRQRDAESEDLSSHLVTLLEPESVASEAYRTLRTNLLYSFVDTRPQVIVMTSPNPGEGKSTTCANLGVVLAQAEKPTLILDCDLRRPAMHNIFALRNIEGLANVLMGDRTLEEVWHEASAGLKILTTGPIPLNPAELLGSQRFAKLLDGVRESFDYVLVDAPPVGSVSDPAILATQGDGVLMVLDARNTRKVTLRRSMRALETVGAKVLGTVINNAEKGKDNYYYWHTYERRGG